ncbi:MULTISPECIES: hypothetical protein [Streptomyces]|uniref:Uncharacterized protein n=2 Tax=Streptomyces TaxID=1883 RepID=A0ABU2XLB1_9ACTN|nr:hypothetical protein [Streptomyces sp. DSM 41529]MDT0546709.1 hypothetical protein [Streptomyces sp. DSM 41529]
MEPQIADLARTAGSTVVALMATDAWQRARERIVALWRRAQPDRADGIDGELETTRDDLLAARDAEDSEDEETRRELSEEWAGRMRRFLVAHPEVVEELRRVLDELSPALPGNDQAMNTTIHMRAEASGSGRVYQAGRDQHITER